jgi:hypothetical protein
VLQLAIMNAGSIGGRLLPNFIADGWGPYNMLVVCLAVSAGLAFSIFALDSFAGMVVFALLYGFWSGSCESLLSASSSTDSISQTSLSSPL